MEPSRRVALVMAGSQGLGLATAQALVRSGHAVAVCSRDRSHVDGAVESLRELGPALGVVADIAQPGAMEDVIAQVASDLMLDELRIDKALFQTGAPGKARIVASNFFGVVAYEGLTKDDPSHLKQFYTPAAGGLG